MKRGERKNGHLTLSTRVFKTGSWRVSLIEAQAIMLFRKSLKAHLKACLFTKSNPSAVYAT